MSLVKQKSNCLLFALQLWFNALKRGQESYIAVRKSRWGYFPHFLFEYAYDNGNRRCVSYIPVNPKHKLLPPPMFTGKVKWGDK